MAELKTSTSETPLGITYVERSRIKFWADNPRRNDKASVEVAELIRGNEFRSPINLWEKDMVVYKGNTSLKALDLLHSQGLKIKGIKYEAGKVFIPCILHKFKTQHDANKYGLSDNKASEFAEWDDDILATLLGTKEMRADVKATGFKEKEISNLLWEPDTTRLRNIQETSAGMLARLNIYCKPDDKEQIIALLSEWAESSGFEGVIVK